MRLNSFGVQAAVSLAAIALSAGMLASGRGDAAVYLPVLTSIVGYWLPAPRWPKTVSPADSSHSVNAHAPSTERSCVGETSDRKHM